MSTISLSGQVCAFGDSLETVSSQKRKSGTVNKTEKGDKEVLVPISEMTSLLSVKDFVINMGKWGTLLVELLEKVGSGRIRSLIWKSGLCKGLQNGPEGKYKSKTPKQVNNGAKIAGGMLRTSFFQLAISANCFFWLMQLRLSDFNRETGLAHKASSGNAKLFEES